MSLASVLQRLEALDVPGLGPGGIALAGHDVRELERYLDGVKVALAHRLAELGEPVADVLRGQGCSSPQAAAIERAEQTIALVPQLAAALARRQIGIDHVNGYRRVEETLSADQQTRLRDRVDEALDSTWSTPEQFTRRVATIARQLRNDDGEAQAARQRADRAASWGYRRDGMGYLRGTLDPETASRVFSMLDAERDRVLHDDPALTSEQAGCDALTNLVLNAGRVMHHGRTEVVVFIDGDSLLHGAHQGGVSFLSNGTHLPVSTVRRLCCEAHIIPMVLGGDGQPLDVGRDQRLATRAQRRALRAMYATCAHPSCEVRFDDCHIHHVRLWEHNGPTDLGNLLPLCSRHHHLVHEGGWQVAIDSRRTLTWSRPDGSVDRTVFWEPPDGERPEVHRWRPPDTTSAAA